MSPPLLIFLYIEENNTTFTEYISRANEELDFVSKGLYRCKLFFYNSTGQTILCLDLQVSPRQPSVS